MQSKSSKPAEPSDTERPGIKIQVKTPGGFTYTVCEPACAEDNSYMFRLGKSNTSK